MIPTHIVVHHSLTKDSGTVSWEAIRWYHMHTKRWIDVGYHYGIELVNNQYQILVGRMMNQVGAHCIEKGMNRKAIAVCLIGNFDLTSPPDAQLDLLVRLTRSLMELFSIPIENVTRHSDHASYKSCPGKLFPWSRFVSML